jgi:biopolymer transport protein ExbD
MGKKKRKVPGLNTTSTADISFMLLIFFLVTTSMDTDKGLARRLPPPPQPNEENSQIDVKERDVMYVRMNANDQLFVSDGNGEGYIGLPELKPRAIKFIKNESNAPDLPELHQVNIKGLGMCAITSKHVISVQCDRGSSYNAYFQVQNELVAAYNEIRDELGKAKFGKVYKLCNDAQQEAIRTYYPQKISEAEPKNFKKGGGK